MRRPPNASLARLAEIREGKPAASPVGLASVIQAGLAHAQPTPAGLFASRTGFAPSVHELAPLHALEHGVVWPTKGWRTDRSGTLLDAPGAVLGRFEQSGLAARTRQQDEHCSFRSTDAGQELVAETVARFGNGWASDASPSSRRRRQ